MAAFNPKDLDDIQDIAKVLSSLKQYASESKKDVDSLVGGFMNLTKQSNALAQNMSKLDKSKTVFEFTTSAMKQTETAIKQRTKYIESLAGEGNLADRLNRAKLQELALTSELSKLQTLSAKDYTKLTDDEKKDLKLLISEESSMKSQLEIFKQILAANGDLSKIRDKELTTLSNTNSELSDTNNISRAIIRQEEYKEVAQKKAHEGLAAIGIDLGAITGLAKKLINPFFAFAALIGVGWERFKSLDDAGEKFRFTTGTLVENSKDWIAQIKDVSHQYSDLGIDVDKVVDAQLALVQVFGNANSELSHSTMFVATMNARFGITSEATAKVLKNLTSMTSATEGQSESLLSQVGVLSKNTKGIIPFGKIVEDISHLSAKTLLTFRANPKEILKATMQARAFGNSLEDVASTSNDLLNFQQTIDSSLAYQVLTGRQLNTTRLMQLKYSGNYVELQKEQNELIKQNAHTLENNVFAQEDFAKATGTSLEQVQNVLATQKLQSTYGVDVQKIVDDQNKSLDKQVDLKSELLKQGKSQGEVEKILQSGAFDNLKSIQDSQSQQNQLANAQKKVWIGLGDILSGNIKDSMTEILDSLKVILPRVASILDFISGITTSLSNTSTFLSAMLIPVVAVGTAIAWWLGPLDSIKLIVETVRGSFGLITATIRAINSVLDVSAISVAVLVAEVTGIIFTFWNDWNIILKSFTDGSNIVEDVFTGLFRVSLEVVKGIMSPFAMLIDKITVMFGGKGQAVELVHEAFEIWYFYGKKFANDTVGYIYDKFVGLGKLLLKIPGMSYIFGKSKNTPDIPTNTSEPPTETYKKAIKNRRGQIVRYDDIPLAQNIKASITPIAPESVVPTPTQPVQPSDEPSIVSQPVATVTSAEAENTSENTDNMVSYLKTIDKNQSELLSQITLLTTMLKEGKIVTGAITLNLDGKKVGEGLAANASLRNKTPFG